MSVCWCGCKLSLQFILQGVLAGLIKLSSDLDRISFCGLDNSCFWVMQDVLCYFYLVVWILFVLAGLSYGFGSFCKNHLATVSSFWSSTSSCFMLICADSFALWFYVFVCQVFIVVTDYVLHWDVRNLVVSHHVPLLILQCGA